MKAIDAINELSKYADKDRVKVLMRFFKTGKGEYGEGDKFIGVYVPDIRTVAKKYIDLSLSEVIKILKSKIHEERLLALIILVLKFKKSDNENKEKIFKLYLANTKYINNWDLVDLSASYIVGNYLIENKSKSDILVKLAKSELLWDRRISMISTFAFIYKGDSKPTFKIAKILIRDKHDLMQKAVGWMLREVGKRISKEIEREFLDKNIKKMGRVAIRYSLEHFDEEERKKYYLFSKQ